ncbi:MAG: hypothetical protein MEEGG_02788 [Eggerthella lenta]
MGRARRGGQPRVALDAAGHDGLRAVAPLPRSSSVVRGRGRARRRVLRIGAGEGEWATGGRHLHIRHRGGELLPGRVGGRVVTRAAHRADGRPSGATARLGRAANVRPVERVRLARARVPQHARARCRCGRHRVRAPSCARGAHRRRRGGGRARDGRRGRAAHRRRVPGRARALQLPVRRTAQARPAGRRAVRNRPKRVECAVRSAPHPSVDLPRSDGFRSRARTAARSSGAGGGGRGVVRDDGRDGCAVGLGRVVRVPAAGRSAFGLAHRRRPAGHRPVRHRARRSSRCAGSRGGHPLRPLSGVEARHRVFGERGRDQHRGGSARDARFQLRHRRAPALYAARFLANDAGGKAEPRRRRCR